MKRIYIFCIIIIVVGIILNIFLYLQPKKAAGDISNNQISYNQSTVQEQPAVSDNRNILKRPIAYIINNIPEAWPQSGLYGADYIYEMLAEGGITRLIAIYTKDGVNKIGPVRSARHNFLDITMEYDAIFAHFGGSPRAFQDISALNIPNLNGISLDGKMYWRDKNRVAPHNAYTNIEKTVEYAKKYKYDKDVYLNHFSFNEKDEDVKGQAAEKISIPYSHAHNTSYEYDNNTKTYKRFMRGKPHIDEVLNQQLTAKNIIIQFAKNTSMDDEDRQDIYLVGSGKGYYISDGKAIEITWEKPARRSVTIFYDKNKRVISLNKGSTWIQVVPIDSKITIQ